MKLRDRLGERLHRIADRVSPDTARRVMGWSFTFEPGEGIRFREDGKGCPLAYLSAADYDRAHSEADDPGVMTKLARVFDSLNKTFTPENVMASAVAEFNRRMDEINQR